jgi:hypothetical protein
MNKGNVEKTKLRTSIYLRTHSLPDKSSVHGGTAHEGTVRQRQRIGGDVIEKELS